MLEYDVQLEVDYASNLFRGSVEISGHAEAHPFELDAVDLAVDHVHVGGVPVPFEHREGRLRVPRAPPASETVRITFSGRAAEGIQTGFFVSRVGALKALTTQLEPESCRRLIPCFDRPDRKAVFRLRVTTRSGLVAISNMPPQSLRLPDGRTQWTFDPTPPMSSYLLYLGVGPFEETVDDHGPTRIVVAGPAGKRAPAERTGRIARTALRGFSDYFDVPYPLPKLHFVTLSDFWAGMENWGAISGSEDQYLLEETASPIGLERSEEVILHEIAHQWFGDLVTLRTWDDLWLNESFATFAVPRVQELTRLRRDPWGEFVMRSIRGELYDSLASTHPVKPGTYDPAEIMAHADEITYLKGSRLIRMVEAFVGLDSFRDGITEYLRDHRLGNATSDDLWAALEEESQRPVTQVMRTWVERAGHPCVSVRQVGPDVELTQRRFTLVPQDRREAPWPIPLTWVEGERRETIVFDTDRLVLPGRTAANLQLDPGRAGFFPVLWPPELRGPINARLPSEAPLDRCAFVQDAMRFLLSGDYSIEEYAAVLRAVDSATDRVTVEGVAHSLDLLQPVLWDVRVFHEAARHFCTVQSERLAEEPVPGEPEGGDVARERIAWMRVRLDPEYARALAGRFDTVDREPAALRQAIATAYARQPNPDAVARLMAGLLGPDPEACTRATYALGETRDPDRVFRALDGALASIAPSDLLAYLVPSLARNPDARAPLWDWLKDHLREFERRGVASPLLTVCLARTLPTVGIGRSLAVRSYFDHESFPEGSPGIARGLELLEANERLRTRVAPRSTV